MCIQSETAGKWHPSLQAGKAREAAGAADRAGLALDRVPRGRREDGGPAG
ncbi:MAG: hypothetical protein ABJD49_03285 [Parasphingorhabdus sp.]